MTFNCTADDGRIFIDNVVFTGDAELALADSSEANYARTNIYGGPNIRDLDESLQDALSEYLLEHLGSEEIAQFIPAYIDYKEQKEYVNWLGDIEGFLKA